MANYCANCGTKLSSADHVCSNCDTALTAQHVSTRKYRYVLFVTLALILAFPILWFPISPFIARMSLKKNTANDNLNASTINFAVSCASALESAAETLTGDDLTVSIKEAEVYYSCHSPFDGICLGYDYSAKNLRLAYTVSNPAHPSLDFDYTSRTPMRDEWITNIPDFTYLLENNISTYLKKRDALPSDSLPKFNQDDDYYYR